MKSAQNPKETSNTFNPVANISVNEVVELLEVGTERRLSTEETALALPILESLKASGEEFTLRDLITEFKAVNELSSFADLAESLFLAGGNYYQSKCQKTE
ncbi:Phage tail assembly protein [Vibrio crassostreae]|nr:Phage tail assembly protein [Vibrio crassostreae]